MPQTEKPDTRNDRRNYLDHADELRRAAGDRALHGMPTENPTETPTHGMERQPQVKPEAASLEQDIRARTMRPHKGDVGREGTNEEIYQGSKMREL